MAKRTGCMEKGRKKVRLNERLGDEWSFSCKGNEEGKNSRGLQNAMMPPARCHCPGGGIQGGATPFTSAERKEWAPRMKLGSVK